MSSQNIKLQRKNSMTYFDLIAWITENRKAVEGCIIDNVFLVQNTENTYILKLYCGGRDQELIIEPSKRINITKYNYPKISSTKITTLRGLIRGDIITNIHILNQERILILELKRGEKKIIVELLPRGVLVILDKNDKILFANEYKEFKDRLIRIGETYKPPPTVEPNKEELEKLIKKGSIAKALGIPQEVVNYLSLQSTTPDINLIREKIKNLEISLINGEIKPCLIEDTTVVPFPLDGCKEYQRFNDAIDDYFYTISQKELSEKSSRKILEEKQKIITTIKQIEDSIKEYENKEKSYRQLGNIILSKAYEIDQLLLDNRPKSKKIKLNLDGVEIELDTLLSATKNAMRFFDEAKEYKRKIERALESLDELKEKLEKIEKQEIEKQNEIKLVLRKKEWYEKYRWSISRNGYLIIAGKDASQNESIVKKYLRDKDIFLHADIAGAPATIIIAQENNTILEDDIYDAAVIAASYSKAWKVGLASVDVFWVLGNQVSKSPPSGEYLNKGSFMIYGKKNFVKNVKLQLAIGLILSENSVSVIVGSEETVSAKTKYYAIIAPGDDDKERIAQKIIKVFSRALPDIKGLNALKTDIEDKIPGKSKIVKTSITYNS
ncbi:ribosome rescue protein RqcH [Saccharolobus islandicus]|uniref:ribosome rescue protein RqcH n=1 Tax=Saccharolobus islandicus TaxID=43080 RepID=UPI00241C2FCC|nr:ribosome rescue protein RqcH [Sulfolobus islandicus]